MKAHSLFFFFIIIVSAAMDTGCFNTSLQPWTNPTEKENCAFLTDVNIAIPNKPVNMYVSSCIIKFKKTESTKSIEIHYPYYSSDKHPWEPILLRVPPGEYRFSSVELTLGHTGFLPSTVKLELPENQHKTYHIKSGDVVPIGVFTWELNVKIENNQLKTGRISTVKYGFKTMEKLASDALSVTTPEWKPYLEKAKKKLEEETK